ncbi:hypothetical protein FQ154_16085 [Paeniglutamicibacter gangotriensis]|uniref:Uncharacterized protein n=1 Tax=Paeniglutamicibacter gangotriensis TaxID=254787 RepID=A0A5B0E8H8_9MICC|nr:hypothetical protein [Paeniglutamicibacter gangotriensis]KAA0974161.1 hypothetical protein FQ154_16085 [Paeniglutamicibacter gangotriensis]
MALKTPDTTRLYEVLVRLHDDVRQIQYPYSAKVLKWGIIKEYEIEAALKLNPEASERTVYAGEKTTDVAARIAGGLTSFIDQEGYREKWMYDGLSEGSWKTFLEQYCMLKPDTVPFNSEAYYRNAELENLLSLVKILDEEVFSSPAMRGPTRLSVSLKSKWWKECHRVFSEAVGEEVYRKLALDERPKNGACHTPEWKDDLKGAIREIAKRWVTSPIWDCAQSTNPEEGVDFTSNNEATVKKFLARNKFTTLYLEGRA